MARNDSSARSSLDLASLLGLLLGFGGVLGGLLLEGGQITDVAQMTGAIIVLSGTFGAVMVTTPAGIFLGALGRVKLVLIEPRYPVASMIAEIVDLSHRARRGGIVSLEPDVDRIGDPFLQKALSLGVDGTDLEDLRRMMELDLEMEETRGRAEAKVFESAGGYAPTIGIIGAVLGLIQVMKNLQDIDKVGHGIAVAFVATVYGVGLANLLFLPAASKIRARMERSIQIREMMLEGVCCIVQGVHPKVIERKLESWAQGSAAKGRTGEGRTRAARLAEEQA